jgi:hypothetical protein
LEVIVYFGSEHQARVTQTSPTGSLGKIADQLEAKCSVLLHEIGLRDTSTHYLCESRSLCSYSFLLSSNKADYPGGLEDSEDWEHFINYEVYKPVGEVAAYLITRELSIVGLEELLPPRV